MGGSLAWVNRIKPIEMIVREMKFGAEKSGALKKCLNTWDLIGYGVGCSVGAGVFSLVGVAAAVTGPRYLNNAF